MAIQPKWAVDIHADAADIFNAVINVTGPGAETIIIGVPGLIIRVWWWWFIPAATTTIQFQDGNASQTVNNLSGPASFTANQGFVVDFMTKPWYTMSIGQDFVMNLGSAAQICGSVGYTQQTA